MIRHERLKRSAVPGGAALAFVLVLLALLPTPVSPTVTSAQAADPFWQLTDVRVIGEESEGNHTYSMSDGSATHTMVSPGTGDRFVSTATWTAPKPSYQGGDTVELTLRIAIAEYVWNGDPDSGYIHQGLNFVGDDIHARIDMAGQWGGGVTAGAIRLRDENGQDRFSVKTDNGTQVVPSAGGAVSAVFPAGGSIGETKGIYIYTPGGFVSYTYTWTAEREGSTTTAPKSRFTIVISQPMYFREGSIAPAIAAGTRLEVVDGKIDCLVTFMGFDNVPVKGTFDPVTGKITATITLTPQNEIGTLWMAFEGTLVVDLAKAETADFMTITGRMWRWLEDDGVWREGDDKGPPGDFYHRLHYTVEGLTPEYPARPRPKGDEDSNLRFFGDPPKGVYILRAASGELNTLEDDPTIYVGDTIVVRPGAEPVFYQGLPGDKTGYWGNSIRVRGGTYLTITEKAELLSFGEFFYKHTTQQNQKFDDFELLLAHLKVKLKGTTVVVRDNGAESTVMVLEGAALCTDTDGGRSVELGEGQTLTATGAGLGQVNTFDAAAELARWDAPESVENAAGFPRWTYIPFGVAGAASVALIILTVMYLTRRNKLRASNGGDYGGGRGVPMGQAVPVMPDRTSIPVMPAGPRQVNCSGCGRPLGEDAAFCGGCGTAGPFIAPDWYYLKAGGQQGQQVGPFLWAQLVAEAQAGRLHPGDLLWNPSLPQWIPAGQVGGLFR